MNAKHAPLMVLVLAIAGAACSGDVEQLSKAGDYIVFGDFYGECVGAGCVDIYRISDGKVFEDMLDQYPSTSKLPHVVEWEQSPSTHYAEIVELIGEIPADLFDETDLVIGQPDAGDWGGFYLETNISGKTRYWLIDKMADNIPKYLRPYTRKLDEAIQLAG
jgi:hypothetical protein